MLSRIVFVVAWWLLANVAAASQTSNSDSEMLRQILTELRAIHADMRFSQSTQFLLAESQTQQGVVSRAILEADNARSKLNDIRANKQVITSELDRDQSKLAEATSPEEKKAFEDRIEGMKSALATMTSTEREWNSTLLDMQRRLQDAEDKLAGIESELNAAITRLAPHGKSAATQ